jgi:hypothetical protein
MVRRAYRYSGCWGGGLDHSQELAAVCRLSRLLATGLLYTRLGRDMCAGGVLVSSSIRPPFGSTVFDLVL